MIRLKRTLTLISLSIALLPVEGILAQPHAFPSGDRPGHWEERERIRENIETLRMYKLLEALDLTSEQSTEFLPALKEFQDAKKRFEERRRGHLSKLEAALESEEDDEKKLEETLEGLRSARREFQADMERFLEKSKAVLTLKQRARLHLFEERFERRLKDTIRRIRGKGPGRRGSE